MYDSYIKLKKSLIQFHKEEVSKYIACICEGAAEQVVIERLLDANKLIFTYDDMLEGEVIRCRSAKRFEERGL